MKEQKVLQESLGFIGNKAEQLQNLFSEYSSEPNEYGKYLKFTNFSELVVNEGVLIETNCFKSVKQFNKALLTKLLATI